MWIKGLYCTEDLVYARRLAAYLDKMYGEKIEIDIVTSIVELENYLKDMKVDVVLYGYEFEEFFPYQQKRLEYAWAAMAEDVYENNISESFVIDKYQSAEQIYKAILEVYSASGRVRRINQNKKNDNRQKIYAFISASGGAGTSAIARAFAKRCATYEKVLYLNLGIYYFNEEENAGNGMDDILVALKSRRNILPIKLESSVAALSDRVNTYGASRNIVDLLEVNPEDIIHLLESIRGLKEYQKIIIDIGSFLSAKEIEILKMADSIIYVLEENSTGIQKYERYSVLIKHLEQKDNVHLNSKTYIFRNKVRQSYENSVQSFNNIVIGWAPYITSDSYEAVILRIAQSDSFHDLEIKNVE